MLPRSRPRSPPSAKVRAVVQEETATLLHAQAQRAGRSLMKHNGRILDATAWVTEHLPPIERAMWEQLLGEPEELNQLLQPALRARVQEPTELQVPTRKQEK